MDELKFAVHMFVILYALPLILYFDLFVETMNIKYLWYKRTFAARNLSTKTRFKKFGKKEEIGSYFWMGVTPFLNIVMYIVMLTSIYTEEFEDSKKGELAVDTIAGRKKSLHGYIFKLLGRGK